MALFARLRDAVWPMPTFRVARSVRRIGESLANSVGSAPDRQVVVVVERNQIELTRVSISFDEARLGQAPAVTPELRAAARTLADNRAGSYSAWSRCTITYVSEKLPLPSRISFDQQPRGWRAVEQGDEADER